MSIYKLYALFTGGTENAGASLDIQFDGFIEAMLLDVVAAIDAIDEDARTEVSFLSTNTIQSNDARGSLMTAMLNGQALTSGGFQNSAKVVVAPVRIPVSAGERLYCHAVSDASITMEVNSYLYVNDTSDPRLRRRR